MRLRAFLVIVGFVAFAGEGRAADKVLRVSTPMPAPTWALLERQLLDSSAEACREFYRKYFDERGRLLCVERWGGDDGPDDAIENCNDWPILHALGASDDIRTMYSKAWEGTCGSSRSRRPRRCRSPRTACTGAVRQGRHVLQGVPGPVRLAPSCRRTEPTLVIRQL